MNDTVYMVTRCDGNVYGDEGDEFVAIFSNMDAVEKFMKANHATKSEINSSGLDNMWYIERPKCLKTGRVECWNCPEYIEHRMDDVPCDKWVEFRLERMSSSAWYTVDAERVFGSNEEYENYWSDEHGN